MQQQEIFIKSTLDGTMQPSLFYASASAQKRPLLVGLHTWSYDRFNQISNMLSVSTKIPPTIFNAVVAIIATPVLAIALRKALSRSRLSID